MEVDAWSEKFKLAIVFDNSKQVQDISRYRIERRRDALLQRNGCRVLRFLVEDVCERLNAVLEEIEAFAREQEPRPRPDAKR